MILQTVVLDFDDTLYKLDIDWDRLKQEVCDILQVEFLAKIGIFQTIEKSDSDRLRRKAFLTIARREIEAAMSGNFLPGGLSFLRRCQKENIKTAIVSRNSREAIKVAFQKKRLNFPGPIIGRENVVKLKPHPEGINKAVNTLGVSKDQSIYIGNSNFSDKKAAKRAQVDFLLFESWEKILKVLNRKCIKDFYS